MSIVIRIDLENISVEVKYGDGKWQWYTTKGKVD